VSPPCVIWSFVFSMEMLMSKLPRSSQLAYTCSHWQPSSLPATSTHPWTPRIPASSNCVTHQSTDSTDLFLITALEYQVCPLASHISHHCLASTSTCSPSPVTSPPPSPPPLPPAQALLDLKRPRELLVRMLLGKRSLLACERHEKALTWL
jgi:hypothetical protein